MSATLVASCSLIRDRATRQWVVLDEQRIQLQLQDWSISVAGIAHHKVLLVGRSGRDRLRDCVHIFFQHSN